MLTHKDNTKIFIMIIKQHRTSDKNKKINKLIKIMESYENIIEIAN